MAQSTITASRESVRGWNSVEDVTQGVDGVEAEADRDERGGVVEGGLHRVHVRPGEGGGVVGLVVEAVNLDRERSPGVKQGIISVMPVCTETFRCQERWLSSTGALRGA